MSSLVLIQVWPQRCNVVSLLDAALEVSGFSVQNLEIIGELVVLSFKPVCVLLAQ